MKPREVRVRLRALACGIAALTASLPCSAAFASRHESVGGPSYAARISGPLSGGVHGRPFDTAIVDLRHWGYREREYAASGVATGGGSTAIPQPQLSTAPAPYRTRIIVRRPIHPDDFNGTVLVEWLNDTAQVDYDADWSEGYREILRGGYAYIGVTAQQEGVRALHAWDPVRYGSLEHPGNGYAISIFAQLLRAVRHPVGINPLAGLAVRHVIADGHSQSGINLHALVDTVASNEHLADGYLIRGDATTKFDTAHLTVPVLEYQSEAELAGPVGRLQNRLQQPPTADDSRFYRLWQVAGATHTGSEGAHYLFDEQIQAFAGQPVTWNERAEGAYRGNGADTCAASLGVGTLDEFPQWYTLDAAIHALHRWVTTARAPGRAPRIRVTRAGAIVRDHFGNAVGGVRDPVVDVPVATYHGDDGCPLSGVTRPLPAATLAALYPTHRRYVDAVRRDVVRCERAGWLLPYDAADLLGRT